MKPSVPALTALLLLGGGTLHAGERVCHRRLGAVTVDDLRVPEGGRCVLNGTRVEGTIKVGTDAALLAREVRVKGNIQAERAASVRVLGRSTVGGSIQVVQGGSAIVDLARVTGDILYDSNDGRLAVTRSTVGGNVQVFQNHGGVEIADNSIDGNLQCKENAPRPTGGGNLVEGSEEDQCSDRW